jgi:hypothetical protein
MSPLRLLPLLSLLSAAAALHLGCGGKVVVDATSGGTGGEGGDSTTSSSFSSSSSSTSVTSSVSTGPGPDCEVLAKIYQSAVLEAAQCNACTNFDGCFDGPVVNDICGCPMGLNVSNQDLIVKVKETNAAWLGAGCKPFACGTPCFVGMTWGCQAGGGTCDGACAPF